MQTLEGQRGWEDKEALGVESPGVQAGGGNPPSWWCFKAVGQRGGYASASSMVSMKPGGGS